MRESLDLLERVETLEKELARLKADARGRARRDAVALPTEHEEAVAEPSTSRRDLLRCGAVVLGAAAATLGASPAEGADGGNVIIGANNIGSTTTFLQTPNEVSFWGISTNAAYAIIGQALGSGVYGSTTSTSSGANGVLGYSGNPTGQSPGVQGFAFSPDAPGVLGTNAKGGNAVRAEVPASTTSDAIALYALNYSSYTGGGPGAGGFAIYGLSAKGHGLVGATAAAGAAAIVGATNGVAGALAAAFYGPVIVGGTLTVVGGAKSAAVPHPDGSHRRLYCVESPESWFEDFGEGRLVCGGASIALDPDFAAVVDSRYYHVFLTGHGTDSVLSVAERTAEGFRVQASPAAEGTFSWRVVAKRKDIPGLRFERVEVAKEPAMPEVPASVYAEPPAPLEPPAVKGRAASRRQPA
jgi:hypothetical protein